MYILRVIYLYYIWHFSGGVKDLKIYADLALMSVEEDDLIAHVTNLHTATIGYAPLIYDVCNIQGEDELIERCEDVWTSLEKDPNLPRKLVQYIMGWKISVVILLKCKRVHDTCPIVVIAIFFFRGNQIAS